MPDLAKQFNKEQIEAALEYIIKNQPVLNSSTQYNLLYKGIEFPPKEVVRWAAKLAKVTNWETMILRGGENTNGPLKRLGFQIISKPDADLQLKLLNDYKKLVKSGNQTEVYKWELIEKYAGRPNLEAEDFGKEMMDIDYRNLIYHNGIAVRNHIAKEKPEDYRNAFKKLFDEGIPLKERVVGFREDINAIYLSLGQTLSDHHDERTIATFLAFYKPNEYPLYKWTFYNKYCKLLGIKEAANNEKYIHYIGLVKEFVQDYIVEDDGISEIKREFLGNKVFNCDENSLILAQDILYQTLEKNGMSFKVLVDEIKDILKTQYETPPFYITSNEIEKEKKSSSEWIKLSDSFKIIKGHTAHYEVSCNTKLKTVTVELHFEDRKHNKDFKKYINDALPADLVWKNWYGAESILYEKVLNLSDEDLADEVVNQLMYIEAHLGNKVRSIIKGEEHDQPKDVLHSVNDYPLNQILYGPPGTGKTYHTINKALEIVNGDEEKNLDWSNRLAVKKQFDERIKEGRILFTTFHQSLSYEDFIEGIKPQEPKGDSDPVSYMIEDGIFKIICSNANTPNQVGFEEAYLKLEKELSTNEAGLIDLKTPTGKCFSISLNKNNNLSLHTGPQKEKQGVLTKENIQKQINGEEKFVGWEGYFKGVIDFLKTQHNYNPSVNNELKNYVLIIDEINRGNVSQIFGELITLLEDSKRTGKPEALKVILPYSKKEFSVPSNVYIIGTMNTADRSVESLDTALRRRFCFEEMMPNYSLLEFDHSPFQKLVNFHKDFNDIPWERWQQEYDKFATDFYSEIGLANIEIGGVIEREICGKIESKSFDLHDAHIYLCDYNLKDQRIDLRLLLKTINQRIELLFDRDHQIGHTFFLKIKESYNLYSDLCRVFKNEIIPLLQEYFFGDYEKIGLILGQGFIKKEEPSKQFFADFKGSTPSDYYKSIFTINNEAFRDNQSFINAIGLLLNKKEDPKPIVLAVDEEQTS
jgi:Cdc6-like AAA superfamily ATPase